MQPIKDAQALVVDETIDSESDLNPDIGALDVGQSILPNSIRMSTPARVHWFFNDAVSYLHFLTTFILPLIMGALGGTLAWMISAQREAPLEQHGVFDLMLRLFFGALAAVFGSSFLELFQFGSLPLTTIALYLLLGLIGQTLFTAIYLSFARRVGADHVRFKETPGE